MTNLTWFEETNNGLIDVSMVCDGEDNGFSNSPNVCENGFSTLQLQVREQEQIHGIINARMKCVGSEGDVEDANTNDSGSWNEELSCDSGHFITGLEIREHHEYGRIVNVKIFCGKLNFSFD